PSSVKRLFGYLLAVGVGAFRGGRIPVRIAGTARSVYSATLVSLRYHVDAFASAAKFGNSAASTCPRPSSSDSSWNSSSTIITTRRGRAIVTFTGWAAPSPRRTLAGLAVTNNNAKTRGAT